MTNEEIMQADNRYYMKTFARYAVVMSHGEGVYVYDKTGKKYIDFLGGIAVNVLGHAHPGLVQAIAAQAGRMIHCSNLYYNEEQAKLAQALAALSGLARVFIGNSGAEANEGAIKLARKFAKTISADKVEIVSAINSFHGRTLATLTATGQEKFHHGYEPLPQGFIHVPFNDIAALRAAVSPERTAAIMLEPIQGEGGVLVPDVDYFTQVRQLCDDIGAVLIVDEIQTGMGRTGTMFAYQQMGFTPDIVTLAKGLAGGVPIGAVMARQEVADAFAPGDHGTTFGGNPLACAAANATLRAIAAENLVANAAAVGAYMTDGLTRFKDKYPEWLVDVRGKGLMLGAGLTKPGRDIVNRCAQQGAIINCTAGNVLRFLPPLNINKGHVDEVLTILDQVLAEQ